IAVAPAACAHPRQHDLPRHGGTAAAGNRPHPAAGRRAGHRPRLRTAEDTAPCRRGGARTPDGRWSRHASPSGRARLRALVRQAADRHAGAPRCRRRDNGDALMLLLGLTGSVAMGKSTVAGFFAEHGVAVFDADRAVHDLYRGEAAPLVESAFPGTVVDGIVDRTRLSARVLHDRAAMVRLETLIHPLVARREEAF